MTAGTAHSERPFQLSIVVPAVSHPYTTPARRIPPCPHAVFCSRRMARCRRFLWFPATRSLPRCPVIPPLHAPRPRHATRGGHGAAHAPELAHCPPTCRSTVARPYVDPARKKPTDLPTRVGSPRLPCYIANQPRACSRHLRCQCAEIRETRMLRQHRVAGQPRQAAGQPRQAARQPQTPTPQNVLQDMLCMVNPVPHALDPMPDTPRGGLDDGRSRMQTPRAARNARRTRRCARMRARALPTRITHACGVSRVLLRLARAHITPRAPSPGARK